MPLRSGTRIGPYEIVAPLGAGGMGEVYRATDTKLGRQVALKVLPPAFANDVDRMARFTREVQVLASLNHPNIAAIYGIEDRAIVMELVEGKDLAGPMPLDEALPIAKQIAEALEAAHEKGIVHRDLKPANIKITPQGVVKLLDFGLAKAAEPDVPADMSNSPTMTAAMTSAGMILGTAAYMSPEQARGLPVDKRTDIWAYGVVIYELLTGKRPFPGETVSDVLAAVLKNEPDWDAVPIAMRRLVRRCMMKDVMRRMRDIGDARHVIEDYLANPNPASEPTVSARRSWIPWSAVLVLAISITIGCIGWWRATKPALLKPMLRLDAQLPAGTNIKLNTSGGTMALSPDGTRLALSLNGADGKRRLHVRRLDQTQAIPLPGTENAFTPVFSPNGDWIAFDADGKLKKIPVEGGATLTLCDAPAVRGVSWGDDGYIVLALNATGSLSRVPSSGGTPSPLTKLMKGERTHRWPQVLPGSQIVLFTAHSGNDTNYDDANIEAVSIRTGERKTLVQGGYSGRYLPVGNGRGHLVYVRENTLFAAGFEPSSLAFNGIALTVVEEVNGTARMGGIFALSASGALVYLSGQTANTWNIYLMESSGKRQPLHATPGRYVNPRFSSDGKRLAFLIVHKNAADIWVKDLERDTVSRLTFLRGLIGRPVWTPDGGHILFTSSSSATPGIYWVRSDGAGAAHLLTERKLQETPSSISPDGKRLAFSRTEDGNSDIFTAPIEGDSAQPRLGKPELFLGTSFKETSPVFSPDGRWLAYVSDESNRSEVYVRPFPGPGGKWQISTGGGYQPFWSKNGRELIFAAGGANAYRLMVVNYTANGGSFIAEKPHTWTEDILTSTNAGFHYDLAPDGKRAAIMLLNEDEDASKSVTHLTFLLNFSDELQRRVPLGGK